MLASNGKATMVHVGHRLGKNARADGRAMGWTATMVAWAAVVGDGE